MKTRQRRQSQRRYLTEMNLIPYIDVMLVLLLIFMLTTPLLTQGVNVDLPKAQSKTISFDQQTPLIVSIDHAGRLFLNASSKPSEAMSQKDLALRIAAEIQLAKRLKHEKPVFVKGDAKVEYDKIVQTMVLLQKAGVDKVGLLTDPQTIK